jgi:hypothetical protein
MMLSEKGSCEKQKKLGKFKVEDRVMVFTDQKLVQDAIESEKNARRAAKQMRMEKKILEEQRQLSPEKVRDKVCKSISTEAHPGFVRPLWLGTRRVPNSAFNRKVSPADRPGPL